MSHIDDYLDQIETHKLPELRARLKRLESGERHFERRAGEVELVETTQRWIEDAKEDIRIYEAILTKHRDVKS